MKKTIIAVTLSLLTMSGLAYADNSTNTVGKTRAEVVAELQVARANGELNIERQYDYPKETFVSTKTRAQVIEELKVAKANGLIVTREYDYPKDNFVSTKTRAQVIDELAASKKSGEYQKMQEFYRN